MACADGKRESGIQKQSTSTTAVSGPAAQGPVFRKPCWLRHCQVLMTATPSMGATPNWCCCCFVCLFACLFVRGEEGICCFVCLFAFGEGGSTIANFRTNLQDDFLGLSHRRPISFPIKIELPDSGDDSLDGTVHPYLTSPPHPHHHHHRHHTTTTTTTNNSNHHDYTTLPEVDENNNEMAEEGSLRISLSRSAPVTGGEKGQRKKPGRKKGQGQ